MKKKIFKQLMAASLATAMTVSLAACGGKADAPAAEAPAPEAEAPAAEAPAPEAEAPAEEEEEVSAYTVLTDADGNVYDLGGMEIIVRDWWSSGEEPEITSDYEEARHEYLDFIQDTYNFKIKRLAISDWGSAPADFQAYVEQGGDDQNYVFVLREDAATTASMLNNYMYDLSTLDCIDFSENKWQMNKLHELFSKGGRISCFYPGYNEARDGLYFNKRLLTDAGIDPEEIFDLQASGNWTWAKFEEILEKCHKDVDGDGIDDITAFDANWGQFVDAAVYSNMAEYVGQENGKYVLKIEDQATIDGLQFANDILKKFVVRPADAQWDYYKEAFVNGQYVFMAEQGYVGGPNGFILDMEDEVGFVCMPQGPAATGLTNRVSNNPHCIPACYDADKAWKIAFAFNLYTDDVPGYEGYIDLSAYRDYKFDGRSVDETIVTLMKNGFVTYHGLIPDLDIYPDFVWAVNGNAVISELIDAKKDEFAAKVEAANN